MASDHASSLAPRGVWYSAVGVGTRAGLDGEAVGTAVRRTGSIAAGDVARDATRGRTGAAVGDLEAGELRLAIAGAELCGSLNWLRIGAISGGTVAVWAERGTAPRQTAMAVPSTAAAEASTTIRRDEAGRRFTRVPG